MPVLRGVTNQENTVIEALTASWVGVDTAGVLHDVLGIDGDRDWLGQVSVSQTSRASLWNVLVTSDLEHTDLGLAGLVSGNVWVGGFGVDTVVDDVLEGILHETSVASLVSVQP